MLHRSGCERYAFDDSRDMHAADAFRVTAAHVTISLVTVFVTDALLAAEIPPGSPPIKGKSSES